MKFSNLQRWVICRIIQQVAISVNFEVSYEAEFLGEAFAALRTRKRALASVGSLVFDKLVFPGEAFIAVRTLKGHFTGVGPLVDDEPALLCKALVALCTPE